MQTSMSRAASFASVEPQALKKSPLPPKVAVPTLKAGTRRPEAPSRQNSMNDVPCESVDVEAECVRDPRYNTARERAISAAEQLRYSSDPPPRLRRPGTRLMQP